MSENIIVNNVRDVVPIVIAHWEDISAEQLGELAHECYRVGTEQMRAGRVSKADPEASLLAGLRLCKDIPTLSCVTDAVALWDRILLDESNSELPAGLLHAEGESKNYGKTRRFAEELFAPVLLRLLDDFFNTLTLAASRGSTPQDRLAAYVSASDSINDVYRSLDISNALSKKLERWLERHDGLIEQLIEVEEAEIEEQERSGE